MLTLDAKETEKGTGAKSEMWGGREGERSEASRVHLHVRSSSVNRERTTRRMILTRQTLAHSALVNQR